MDLVEVALAPGICKVSYFSAVLLRKDPGTDLGQAEEITHLGWHASAAQSCL